MKTRAWEINSDSDFIMSEKIIVCLGYKLIEPNLEKVGVGPGSCQNHLWKTIISRVTISFSDIQKKTGQG